MFPPLSAAVRVFLCTRPTDLRKGFDGLSGLVQECFSQDVLTGHLFLFLNRRRDRIKILYFDRDGLVIWYKRQAPDYPHPCCFTGSCGHAHNRARRPAASGGMDPCPPPGGPGRSTMSRAAAVTAPPRARPSSGHRGSTDFGVS
jgi:hypothetical protein